jgi:hypothetical protein
MTESRAVEYARSMIGTTRLEVLGDMQIRLAQRLMRVDADLFLDRPAERVGSGAPENEDVWLVIFEGDYQVAAPGPTSADSPEPPVHGCIFAIFNVRDGGYARAGARPCDQINILP